MEHSADQMEQRLHWSEGQTGNKAAAAQDQMESKGGLQHGLERAHNRHYVTINSWKCKVSVIFVVN